MRVILRENNVHTMYGIKKVYCNSINKTHYMYILLETDKTIEIEFKDKEEMEYQFSTLYTNGRINLLNTKYKFVE